MLKKTFSLLVMIVLIIASGFLITGCSCGSNGYVIKVTFINADSELGLTSYQFEKDFNEPADITFDILEGFDHTGLKGTINNKVIDYSVEFSDPEIEKEYEYSVKKTITYSIDQVSRAFELVVDLANVQKKTFEITLSNNLSGFSAVTVSEEQTKNLTVLNENNILTSRTFEDNKLAVKYGEYVILIYRKTNNLKEIDALYSTKNNFSLNTANLGALEYAYYNVAKRGNSLYSYNGEYLSRLYYIGKIQEDLNLQDTIPNYKEEKGFIFEKTPNTFYLITNMEKYSSNMLTINTYSATNQPYNAGDKNLDKIDNQVVIKNSPAFNLYNRYDVHKYYIGNDLINDKLLTTEDKLDLHSELYIRIESEVGVEHLNLYLLLNEKDKINASTSKLIPLNIFSDKGYAYAKLNKELISSFCVDRSYVGENGEIYNFEIGNAILYIKVDYDYIYSEDRFFENTYSLINLPVFINNSQEDVDYNLIDYHLVAYILNEDGSKDFGLIDYHYVQQDIAYFRTDKLYDENGTYLNTLYVDVFGPEYSGFKNTVIMNIDLYKSAEILNFDEMLIPEDVQEFNGITGYKINLGDKHPLNEYAICAYINLSSTIKSNFVVDFSGLELPQNLSEGVYATNNISFSDLNDFVYISYLQNPTTIELGANKDLYYLVACPSIENFEFDIYLLPEDKTTKITKSKDLYDIAGNPIVLEINGINYQIKVMYQVDIYQIFENKFYAG